MTYYYIFLSFTFVGALGALIWQVYAAFRERGTKQEFSGRIDMLIKDRQGRLWVRDFKTKSRERGGR